jgi:uncharacterized membrane protein
LPNNEESEFKMAIAPGIYFGTIVMTLLTVLVFFILVLAFLYVIWGREETPQTPTKPKAKIKPYF